MTDPAKQDGKSRPPLRGWLTALVILAVAVVGIVAFRPYVGGAIAGLEAWVTSMGPWGPVAFVGAYAALTTVGAPMWTLTVLSGVLFGPALGIVLSSVASTVAATAGMLCARYVARGFVTRRLEGNRHFAKLNALIETHGSAVVAFTRLVPLFPFSPLNFAFGLTAVRAPTYVFWSWLCMLPTTVIYVVGGGTLKAAVADGRVPWPAIGGAAVLAGVLVLVGRGVRRKMSATTGHAGGGDTP